MPENTGQIFKRNEACFFISEKGSFISLKIDFFTIFVRTLLIFLRVFFNFTLSTEEHLGPPPHKKMEFFLTLVNG